MCGGILAVAYLRETFDEQALPETIQLAYGREPETLTIIEE
jgi:hypothetical protein